MSAPERIPARRVTSSAESSATSPSSTGAPAQPSDGSLVTLLAEGELTVRGRVREASNAVLYCTVSYDGRETACVYKPVAGERPLWDFPDGTLAQREVAAYAVSEATGWGLVPPTVLRDGPYGEGMCQLWIEGEAGSELLALVDGEEAGEGWKAVGFAEVGEGRTALLVHADDPRLRRLAVLDAVVNNADRKGGHLLPAAEGRLYGIDHGVTFNAENKLRTLLWGWAGEPLTDEALEVLAGLRDALGEGGALAAKLVALITPAELDATRERVAALLKSGRHPEPSGDWPAIPWPPV
ncbi:SCO1664 family protein [Streptomyces griseiscabiei]|uniref:SCO1664 family protein n=1 Tax=Streptomyces griseiscabiei TaxID=2993540 RepID=A0ABU4LGR0_9ACTN|nr:SCO1664 family protein [Streptomyces griseiscabiei]MBZ3902598.1 SCO1664 family protein [Streptomyces griseiscabiei]MDX2914966.1 SCO1664 family protein [Streptomyces griseiscabiei]